MNSEDKFRKIRQQKAKKIATERIENKRNQFKELEIFHFTDKRNLESISKHGLLGWESLESPPYNYKREVNYYPASNIPAPGSTYGRSRYLDVRKGYTNHIRLTKDKGHPMTGSAEYWNSLDLVFLKISNQIIDDLVCLFSDTNATKTGAIINHDISTFLNSTDIQAEVLVEGHIPSQYILDVIYDWRN